VIVERSLKFVSEYTRTVLSELQVATMGRVGCGAESHARSREGGVRSERRERVGGAIVGIFCEAGGIRSCCRLVVEGEEFEGEAGRVKDVDVGWMEGWR
jgi:hypothetical protein